MRRNGIGVNFSLGPHRNEVGVNYMASRSLSLSINVNKITPTPFIQRKNGVLTLPNS